MGIMPVLVTVAVLMAALAFVAGFSLLNRRPWGRMLAIVLAVLSLFKFPFGTALGIYTLWVLAPATSAMEYDSMAEPG
jgi:glucan phosphoethanolaminetransferase (alkaline phosphatase superfamily)